MAHKEGNPLVKLIIFAAIVFAAYKFGWPWMQSQGFLKSRSSASSKSTAGGGCVDLARSASAAWGDGVVRFMNPPADPALWSEFYAEIDRKITTARGACGCIEDSCAKSRNAMLELRGQLSAMDAAVRSGGPPATDLVRGQEKIDALLDEASAALNQGK